MKKNRTMRIAVLMLALTLLTCCFVGSTFAKYTSTGTGSGSVEVAQWAFTADANDIVATGTGHEFDLFATITETDGTAEDDVVGGKIAPGTKGQFHFALVNGSEVTVEYTIVLTPALNEVPIKWSLDGSDYTKTIDEVNAALTAEMAIGASADSAVVYWMWDFNDAGVDNAHAGKTVTVNVSVTAEQVD